MPLTIKNFLGLASAIKLPPDLEQRFQQVTRERYMPMLRLASLCGLAVLPLWNIWDRFMAPDMANLFLLIRLCTSAGFALLFLLTYRNLAARYAGLLTAVSIIVCTIAIALILFLMPKGFDVGMVCLLIPFLWIPLMPSIMSALSALLISDLIILGLMAIDDLPRPMLINAAFLLSTVSLITLAMNYIIIQTRKTSFMFETKMELARVEAEQADRAKSAFLATMSHEVRTPLNGILGIANLLEDTRMDGLQRGFVETIKYSGETLLAMLNEILDFSKLDAGKMSAEIIDFDLNRLVKSVADLMQSRASEKGLLIRYDIRMDTPLYISSDPTRLRQILLNLVNNAIKFTERGHIDIRVSSVSEHAQDARLRFDVVDTGIGISEEEKQKLFKEFSQVDSTISRKYGGTGLGLSICFKIVELLQGEIGVSSVKGQGSTFWFEIPVGISDHDVSREEEKRSSYAITQPLHILVVDDNEINQKVATGLLQRLNHTVTIAGNGLEAIKHVKAETFDLILMDMQMPVMDGLEATRQIKALGGKTAAIPIIALTANALKSDNELCTAVGMVDHISKPINPADLYNKIALHTPESVQLEPEPNVASESGSSGSKDVLDTKSLEQLESFLGRDYILTLLNDTFAEFPKYIERIQTGDTEAVLHAAHDLKGLSATLGLMALSSLASGIEKIFEEGHPGEAKALVEQLPARYREAMRVLYQVYPVPSASGAALHSIS